MLLMKTKNILADVKSKSIKEVKEEINDILYSRDLILSIDKKEVYEN